MAEQRALVRNAGDPKQVKRAKESQKERRDRELNELRNAGLYLPSARVLWRVLERCGINQLSFRSDDPHMTSFNEGGRNVGLFLLAELFEADPLAYSRMQKDAADMESKIIEPKPRTDESDEDDDGN
jgi:hypothetical protein